MKSLLWRFLLVAMFGIAGLTQVRADEKPKVPAPDLYELRVYMGYPVFDVKDQEPQPQIKTQIEVGKYFFAKNILPTEVGPKGRKTIYIASGVLHPATDGKFPLERTFMWWGDGASSLTVGPNTIPVELDKPVQFAVSMGLVMGYTAVLSKVTPPAKPVAEEDEVGAKTSSAVPRP